MSELINLSLTDQILGLADKSFSSKEITEAYLNAVSYTHLRAHETR